MAIEILSLDPLQNIDYTALDYETLQEELINYIRANYAARGINDDFLDSSAGKLMIDMLAYLGNILAFRADTLANEAYLPTAIRKENIINLLKLIGEQMETPKAASVNVVAIPSNIPLASIPVPARYPLNTTGADGQAIQFEIMEDSDDYWSNIEIPAGVNLFNLNAYEGEFRFEYFQSNGQPDQTYKLTYSPVIWESIQVSVSPVPPTGITPSELSQTSATKVLSLVDPSVDTIIYKETFDKDNIGTLYFANELFGKIPPTGYYVYIAYRTGGGERGNISDGSINVTADFIDTVGNIQTITFGNPDSIGIGGEEAEDINIAKENVPLRVRTAYKLVTVEDYATLLRQKEAIRDVDILDYNTDREINAIGTVPPNSVFIWVYPTDSDVLTDDLRQELVTFLEERRLVAIDHQLFSPSFIDWDLTATVYYDQFSDPLEIDTLIKETLIANFSGDSVRFGKEIRRSKVLATIQNIGGVVYVELSDPAGDILPQKSGEIARLLEPNITLSYVRKVV